jgi:hypothetical protein
VEMARLVVIAILLIPAWADHAAANPSCAKDAIADAAPLLALHAGEEDDRIAIDDHAKELPAIRNPAEPKQSFRVFEVRGSVYKGQYRMRFIYDVSADFGCVLMGQEILEVARP